MSLSTAQRSQAGSSQAPRIFQPAPSCSRHLQHKSQVQQSFPTMSEEEVKQLPLGAVRTAGGQVVVPASRRADGSTRKPIRIR